MSNIVIAILASFAFGALLGGLLVYMFLSARFQQAKQSVADELHRVIEREERAGRMRRRAA